MNESIRLVVRAAAFAAERHRQQRRRDELTPYVNHPLELARILVEVGEVDDPVCLAAALLHDTVEDTATTRAELESAFGAEVAAVVAEVTDDKSLPKAARKERQVERAPGLSDRAKRVKLADKIANVRDLGGPGHPISWDLERRRAYVTWARRVVAALGPIDARMDAEFDAVASATEAALER